jgi:PAS domain S-box-containing protein
MDIDQRPRSQRSAILGVADTDELVDREIGADEHDRDRVLFEQTRLLELIATGAPLDDCLIAITAAVSRLQPGARAALMIADEARESFERAYSAEVPSTFGSGIVGASIEEFAIGTCGTAVFKSEPVTCTDVETDDRWALEWRELCKAHGLLACHSEPVLGSAGKAIASLVIFFDHPHRPSEWEREVARLSAHLASIAIERDRSIDALRRSDSFNHRVLACSSDCIKVLDLDGKLLSMSDGGRRGLGLDDVSGLIGTSWPDLFDSGYRQAAEDAVRSAAAGAETAFEGLVPKVSGGSRWWNSVVSPIPDADGNPEKLLVVSRDIDDRKRTEQALRDSEVQVAIELADMTQLQDVSARLASEDDADALYNGILDAAVAVMRSDCGSMQMLFPDRNELLLLASHGFSDEAAKFWKWVTAQSACTCGIALKTGTRSVVADVETCEFMAGSSDKETYLKDSIRAVQSTPLVTRSGQIVGMISTHWRAPHEPSARELRHLDILARQAADLIERNRSGEILKRQQNVFVELINACPFGIYVVDSDFCIRSMNQRSQDGAFANVRPVIGRRFDEAMRILWPEDVAQEIIGHFRHTLDSGEPFQSQDFIRSRSDIDEVEGYEWELHRLNLPDGRFGVICYYYDSTELRNAQRQIAADRQRLALMVGELNHRVKNSLSIVQALAHQSFGGADVPAHARHAFEGRLDALAQAHDVLTREHWAAADLKDIVAGALKACGVGDRAAVAGPSVRFGPHVAVTLAMALHELCTNAIKYGALSVEGGRVSIGWTISGEREPRLHFRWQELGGPPVREPSRRGFGSRLIERALAGDLKGDARLDYARDGLAFEFDAPLPEHGLDEDMRKDVRA